MPVERLVHIVDADADSRTHGARLLRSAGYDVHTHASGEQFLHRPPGPQPGCVLLDIRLPEPDGLAIQDKLMASGMTMPAIVFTGDNNTAFAARALRAGALNFLEKPYADADLLGGVAVAFEKLVAARAGTDRKAAAAARLALLSPREIQVLEGLLAGMPNKLIAHNLGLSVRTVEMHRLRMMQKLHARSLAAVFRLWLVVHWEKPESVFVELPSTLAPNIAP